MFFLKYISEQLFIETAATNIVPNNSRISYVDVSIQLTILLVFRIRVIAKTNDNHISLMQQMNPSIMQLSPFSFDK